MLTTQLNRIPVATSSPHHSIDERLEKKRERNRIAATRCRQRKLHKIQTLGTLKDHIF